MEEILLLLYANNFFNLANYILLVLLALFLRKSKGKIFVPRNGAFVFLLIASLTYMVFYIRNFGMPSSTLFFLRFLAPILMYYYGVMIGKDGTQRLRRCILYIGIGGFIHGALNVVTNRNVNFLLINGRQYNDIYGGYISGTLQSLYFVIMCSLLFNFIFEGKNKWMKLGGVFCVLIGLYGSISNASRTPIYVTVLVFIAGILIYQHEKTNFISAIARTSGIVLGLALIAILIVWFDLFHVKEWYAGTSLGRRAVMYAKAGNTLTDNDRWTYASDILKMLPSNPFGNVSYPNFAHNLWVDVAKEAGVVPFLAYIGFALSAIRIGVKLFNDKQIQIFDKIFFIAVLVGLFMVFFTEPIMQGSPITFSFFCFIVGGVATTMQVRSTDPIAS